MKQILVENASSIGSGGFGEILKVDISHKKDAFPKIKNIV